ncbi:Uma2 family endonuclease [Tundrisphaera sp. TA3]|uniref:Uma2 family endonuclease n=1 Tax=Tundrisphaera sp. TA3 TaxID=3435775 RepID=UPI003EB8C303
MATISPPEITPEDLLAIRDRPMPELVEGELVERPMGQKSDGIASLLLFYLMQHVVPNRLGWVNGAQGSYQIFPDDPKKVRIPDGSFTRLERLPNGFSEGHGRVAPDLVFEIISPKDLAEDLEHKVMDYLSAGIPMVWVVYPRARVVRVIRGDGTGGHLRSGDVLSGEDILPGFTCPVASLFG